MQIQERDEAFYYWSYYLIVSLVFVASLAYTYRYSIDGYHYETITNSETYAFVLFITTVFWEGISRIEIQTFGTMALRVFVLAIGIYLAVVIPYRTFGRPS